MKTVSLQSIDLKHFKSFISAHIDMRRGPGLRMIFGENQREPRLGANGAGKSTCWDSVCFCLNGRSVRGKRTSDLVTTGQKTTSVTTTWLINGETQTIRRSGPPERVYINDQPSDQKSVDELIGLSRDRFLSSVLFGQAKPLFIDLPIPERGDLLDEVLGLGFWMRAADLATSKWNAAGVEMQRVQREIARLDGALSELPNEDDLRHAAHVDSVNRARQIDELESQKKLISKEYRELRRTVSAMRVNVEKEEELRALYTNLHELKSEESAKNAVIRAEVERLSKEIDFFTTNDNCPTCGQEITEEFAEKHREELWAVHTKKSNLLARSKDQILSLEHRLAAYSNDLRDLVEKTREKYKLGLAIADKRGQINTIDNRIQVIRNQPNTYEEQLRNATERRATLDSQLSQKHSEQAELSAKIDKLDYWRQGFRRVRIFCLTRVLAELEIETMSAARSLGLAGWHIKFSGETETKSGSVKLGIQAIVQSPEAKRDFDSWSPGEGQRIRCASALGLASLIQRHSGVSYDLEVWDEPSAWLSAEGIDDLFECLRERAYARGKSIWVCDPRAGISHGGFDEVWNVVKDANGSRIDIARGINAVPSH